MKPPRTAVLGIGATGAVLAAALLKHDPETILVDPRPGLAEAVKKSGLKISGQVDFQVPVRNFLSDISALKEFAPDWVFVATKTFHLASVLEALRDVRREETKIVSTHNGLGTEDVIADMFGPEAAFRMSLNFGVSMTGPGQVEMAFFNRPNHLGGLTPASGETGGLMAGNFTAQGLDTEYVPDIKLNVWKKMIMKCTMASICAVTDRTLGQVLSFPPTREIAENCFREILAVARAQGYDLGPDYIDKALGYLEKASGHKDSMCYDVAQKSRTEIDFLGGKVVEYARQLGISTPYFQTMANLVRAMEDTYLPR